MIYISCTLQVLVCPSPTGEPRGRRLEEAAARNRCSGTAPERNSSQMSSPFTLLSVHTQPSLSSRRDRGSCQKQRKLEFRCLGWSPVGQDLTSLRLGKRHGPNSGRVRQDSIHIASVVR